MLTFSNLLSAIAARILLKSQLLLDLVEPLRAERVADLSLHNLLFQRLVFIAGQRVCSRGRSSCWRRNGQNCIRSIVAD